jgi:hypothetical protein
MCRLADSSKSRPSVLACRKLAQTPQLRRKDNVPVNGLSAMRWWWRDLMSEDGV